jgi:hypothetical protein
MGADAALPGANGVEAGDIEVEDTVAVSPAKCHRLERTHVYYMAVCLKLQY